MARGVVARVVSGRGFGFITGEQGEEVFFHRSVVRGGLEFDALVTGQFVEYEGQSDAQGRGQRATVVRRAAGAPASAPSPVPSTMSAAAGPARPVPGGAQSAVNRVAALLADPALSPQQRTALAEGVERAARLLRDVLVRAGEPAHAERGEMHPGSDAGRRRAAAEPPVDRAPQEQQPAPGPEAAQELLDVRISLRPDVVAGSVPSQHPTGETDGGPAQSPGVGASS